MRVFVLWKHTPNSLEKGHCSRSKRSSRLSSVSTNPCSWVLLVPTICGPAHLFHAVFVFPTLLASHLPVSRDTLDRSVAIQKITLKERGAMPAHLSWTPHHHQCKIYVIYFVSTGPTGASTAPLIVSYLIYNHQRGEG